MSGSWLDNRRRLRKKSRHQSVGHGHRHTVQMSGAGKVKHGFSWQAAVILAGLTVQHIFHTFTSTRIPDSQTPTAGIESHDSTPPAAPILRYPVDTLVPEPIPAKKQTVPMANLVALSMKCPTRYASQMDPVLPCSRRDIASELGGPSGPGHQ